MGEGAWCRVARFASWAEGYRGSGSRPISPGPAYLSRERTVGEKQKMWLGFLAGMSRSHRRCPYRVWYTHTRGEISLSNTNEQTSFFLRSSSFFPHPDGCF